MDGERRPPQGRVPAGRAGAAAGWPEWLDAVENVLLRAAIVALVLLVMVQTFTAGSRDLAADVYGRALEEWGYAPDTSAPVSGAGQPAGRRSPAGGAPSALPAARPHEPPPAGSTAGVLPPFVVTLRRDGPGPVTVTINGQAVARLGDGEARALAVKPGDRIEVRATGPAAGEVRVIYASAELAAPRPGQSWPLERGPALIEPRLRGGP